MNTRRSNSPSSFPTSLLDFTRRFPDDDACWEYLRWLRWPKEGAPRHPKTGTAPRYFIEDRKLWEFPDGYQMSIQMGTVMERSRQPLLKWFWAVYFVAVHTPGISAMQLSKHLTLRYETAFQLLHKLRAGLVDPDRTKLTGNVEVDETFIGGKSKGLRGRAAGGKVIVVGAVEVVTYEDKKGRTQERPKRIRLRQVPDASGAVLQSFVGEVITKRARIRTDGWTGYSGLRKAGYTHTTIPGDPEQLPHIHRVFSNLKNWLQGTHHGVSERHLQAYLNEFTFRFNRRVTPLVAFQSALGLATKHDGPEYRELYTAGTEKGWRHANPKG